MNPYPLITPEQIADHAEVLTRVKSKCCEYNHRQWSRNDCRMEDSLTLAEE